ncbi:hypothetical protein EVAR_7973_1 [Eumeta japonica]|uniref:Uncharacterized protein n=1 Tax=Eumeta variegata TaxID=151549 RepID=A0A4C1TK03_EUMVA|nr:hypothetical protein EVAR_7973_1 [Eumeta japonica]
MKPTQFDCGSRNGPRYLVQCCAYQIQGRGVKFDVEDRKWVLAPLGGGLQGLLTNPGLIQMHLFRVFYVEVCDRRTNQHRNANSVRGRDEIGSRTNPPISSDGCPARGPLAHGGRRAVARRKAIAPIADLGS